MHISMIKFDLSIIFVLVNHLQSTPLANGLPPIEEERGRGLKMILTTRWGNINVGTHRILCINAGRFWNIFDSV